MVFINMWRGSAVISLVLCSLAVLVFPGTGLDETGSLRAQVLEDLAVEKRGKAVGLWTYPSKDAKEKVKEKIAGAVEAFEKLDAATQSKRVSNLGECASAKPTARSSKLLKKFLKKLGLRPNALGGRVQREFRATLWSCFVEKARQKTQQNGQKSLMTFESLFTYGDSNADFPLNPTGRSINLKGDTPKSADSSLDLNSMIPDEPPTKDYYNAIEEGFTVPPSDQGMCGSCYAVSFYTMLSGRCWKETEKKFQLSSQQFLSCKNGVEAPWGETFQPCSGGSDYTLEWMYSFVSDQGTQSTEKVPYTAEQISSDNKLLKDPGQCAKGGASESACMAAPKKFGILNSGSNNQIARAIEKYGIVQIWILASTSWKGNQYPAQGTILNEQDYPIDKSNPENGCKEDGTCPTNHAVVLVGYNMTGRYWIMRNSWGMAGISGYFFVSMDGDQEKKPPGAFGVNEQMFVAIEDSMSLGEAWEDQVEEKEVNPFVEGLNPWTVTEESGDGDGDDDNKPHF